MTTFEFNSGGGPLIHALLIGVGAYRSAQEKGASMRLSPVGGAAKSAFDFADFLAERKHRLFRPLGSIELLVSDPNLAAGQAAWHGQVVDEPTITNINTAVQSWLRRLDRDEASMAVFYAGGHGCFRSGVTHLFAEDAGSWGDPLAHSIHLTSFQTGMSTKRARHQWFIFDCCQDLPEEISKQLGPTSGTNLVGSASDQVREVGQLRIDAASPGLQAFTGAKTHLMDALDMALRNHAAGPIIGGWGVKPNLLMDAINYHGKNRYGADWTRCTVSSNADDIDCLHRLDDPPQVEVVLSTEPGVAYPDAKLKLIDLRTSATAQDVAGNPCDWGQDNSQHRCILLHGGVYRATATFDPGAEFLDSADIFQAVPPHYPFCLRIVAR